LGFFLYKYFFRGEIIIFKFKKKFTLGKNIGLDLKALHNFFLLAFLWILFERKKKERKKKEIHEMWMKKVKECQSKL
jgi:hypothetical protein